MMDKAATGTGPQLSERGTTGRGSGSTAQLFAVPLHTDFHSTSSILVSLRAEVGGEAGGGVRRRFGRTLAVHAKAFTWRCATALHAERVEKREEKRR